MWLINAFSQEKADFSGIDGRQHWLYIGNILHEAFIEVNEEGTRAAAATALQYIGAVLNHPELPPVVFQAGHPFLYLIIANQSRTILFMARLTDFRS